MKLTADQYYCVYFCVFEEPAMFKPLSYSSEFVSIRHPFVLSTDNASFKAKNIRAGSPDLFMSMGQRNNFFLTELEEKMAEFYVTE